MKVIASVLAVFLLLGCAQPGGRTATTKLETKQDKVSYSIGLNIGQNMLRDSVEFEPNALLQGIMDAALDSSNRLMRPHEVDSTLMAYQQELTEKKMEGIRRSSSENLSKGEAFLAENKTKEGVVTLPSGLQYKVLRKGTGARPTKDQFVTAHYRGKHLDGSEFDSSYDRNEPATFRLNNVISGWTEALQLMEVGSKWELYIPPGLGYGEQGSGPIGPNEVLIFEVDLLGVK